MKTMKVPTWEDMSSQKTIRLHEAELAFWRNTAERLRDDIEYLFDTVQRDGEIELSSGSRKVALVVVKEADE
jgi:hypothetical protein